MLAKRKDVYPEEYAGMFVLKVSASGHYETKEEFLDALKSGCEHIEYENVEIIATEGEIVNVTEQEREAEAEEIRLITEMKEHEHLESFQFTAF